MDFSTHILSLDYFSGNVWENEVAKEEEARKFLLISSHKDIQKICSAKSNLKNLKLITVIKMRFIKYFMNS